MGFWNRVVIGVFTVSTMLAISQPAFPDAVIFSGSDVKTLKPNIDLFGNAKILSGAVDPSSVATSAPIGSMYMNTSNGNLYKKQDAGSSTNWVKISAGSTNGINYIANPDSEQGTTGWSTYADAAGVQPVDGTGGSPNTTWTRSTSSPLRGTGSFLLTKSSGASRQGEGVSYPFTIDSTDQARVLSVSFDYNVASGTFTAADGITAPASSGTSPTAGDSTIEVYVYDVTNSVLIPVSPHILTCNGTQCSGFKGTFQTASNSTSYRLILHTSYTTNAAMTAKFDNFFVGPQSVAYGPAISDWVAYTPTISAGFGTATNVSAFHRRVGDSEEVIATFTVGTTAASIASISLPAGENVDSAKLSLNNTTGNPGNMVGKYQVSEATANVGGSLVTAPATSTSVVYFGQSDVNASSHLTPANGTGVTASSVVMSVYFRVPILGFSSTNQMSNETDTRVVALLRSNVAGTALSGSAATIPFATAGIDTHNGWSVDTYTVPVSGIYKIDSMLEIGSNNAGTIYLQKNGSTIARSGAVNVVGYSKYQISSLQSLVAGDTIRIQADSAGTPTLLTNTGANNISILRLSGPSTIAAPDTVAMKANTSNTSMTNSTPTQVVYSNKVFDTHGGYNTSTGTYTVPVSGTYQVEASVCFTSNATGLRASRIYKNGVYEAGGSIYAAYSGDVTTSVVSSLVKAVAGDTIAIDGLQTSGGSVTLASGLAADNHFSIVRVGN